MIKHIFSAALLCVSASVFASGPAVHLDKAPIDLTDKASLQNGQFPLEALVSYFLLHF